jgi:hypothetical protein
MRRQSQSATSAPRTASPDLRRAAVGRTRPLLPEQVDRRGCEALTERGAHINARFVGDWSQTWRRGGRRIETEQARTERKEDGKHRHPR